MKNKEKFDLRKILAYDIIKNDNKKLYVYYDGEEVAKLEMTSTYIDTLFAWLEKEYGEKAEREPVKRDRKKKEKLEIPVLPDNSKKEKRRRKKEAKLNI